MESRGNVIAILERKDGTSQAGKAWATQSFVIETPGQYPRKQCFEVFGAELIQQLFGSIIAPGNEVIVSFDLESREWQRQDGTTTWFTSAKAWKVIPAAQVTPQPPGYSQQAAPQTQGQAAPAFPPFGAPAAPQAQESDDLPF